MDHHQEEVVVDDGTWIENGIRTEMKGQIDREVLGTGAGLLFRRWETDDSLLVDRGFLFFLHLGLMLLLVTVFPRRNGIPLGSHSML